MGHNGPPGQLSGMKHLLFLAFWLSAVLAGIHAFTGEPSWLIVFIPLLSWLALVALLYVLGVVLTITAIGILVHRDRLDLLDASQRVYARASAKGANPLKGDLWRKGAK